MDAMTTQQASHDLDGLIDRVIDNVQPTILCNDKGNKAVLMSLDEFSSWQKNLYLLSNPVKAKSLLNSIQESKVGRVTPLTR